MAKHGPKELQEELAGIANSIIADGRGILASDEPGWMIAQRFKSVGVIDESIERRRDYRHMLYKTKDLGKTLGGVIMENETFYQEDANGVRLIKALTDQGIKVGVKADKGWMLMPGTMGEMTTQGLDGLTKRCEEYKKNGASFVKWRCPIKIQGIKFRPQGKGFKNMSIRPSI